MAGSTTSTGVRFYETFGPGNGKSVLGKVHNGILTAAKWTAVPGSALTFAAADYMTSMTPSMMEMRPGTFFAALIGLTVALGVEIPILLGYGKAKLMQAAGASEAAILRDEIDQKERMIRLMQAQLREAGEKRTQESGLPFDIVEKIGEGTQGSVYKIRDYISGKLSVLKLPDLITAAAIYGENLPKFLNYYLKEAKNLGRVDHENVVKTTSHRKISLKQWETVTGKSVDRGQLVTLAGEKYLEELEDDVPHLEMELLVGESMGSIMDKINEETEIGYVGSAVTAVLDRMTQLACALDELRRQEIVHRDIKPDNIFLTKYTDKVKKLTRKILKMLDFGIAKDVVGSGTQLGAIMGSAGYMSPEQIKGQPAVWESDLFALGAVLWTELTGETLDQDQEKLAIFLTQPIPNLEQTLRFTAMKKGYIHHLVWNIDSYVDGIEGITPAEKDQYRLYVKDLQRRLLDGLQDILNKTLAIDPKDRYQDGQTSDSQRHPMVVAAHDQLVTDLTKMTQLYAEYKTYIDWFRGNLGQIITITPVPPEV